MDYNKSYSVLHVGFWIGFVVAILGLSIKISFLVYLGIILVLGSLVQAFIFYKCPNCGKSFNIKGKKPKYCPECSYKLEEL